MHHLIIPAGATLAGSLLGGILLANYTAAGMAVHEPPSDMIAELARRTSGGRPALPLAEPVAFVRRDHVCHGCDASPFRGREIYDGNYIRQTGFEDARRTGQDGDEPWDAIPQAEVDAARKAVSVAAAQQQGGDAYSARHLAVSGATRLAIAVRRAVIKPHVLQPPVEPEQASRPATHVSFQHDSGRSGERSALLAEAQPAGFVSIAEFRD